MAKEKETEKQLSKLEIKAEKANAKKEELNEQLKELKEKILNENNEKEKEKLRKQRDALIEERDAIIISDEKVKIPMSKKVKKSLISCIAIVCVIALLFGYVATGAAKHGFISSLGWPQKVFTGMTVTDVDGEKHPIKVSTYNYYFAVYYNNLQQTQSYMSQYGASLGGQDTDTVDFDKSFSKQTTEDEDGKKITWAEKAEKEVLKNIKDVYGYYFSAVKANKGKEPEITEEQQKELDETLDSYKESAKKYGFTLSAYLMAAMGDGVDADTFIHEAKAAYIADNYKNDYQEQLSKKEYTDKEINDYLEKHRDELVSVDVKYFEATNADDAKAFVKALDDDGSNFAELAVKYAEDEDKSTYKDKNETTYYNATRSVFQNLGGAIAEEKEEAENDDNAEHNHTYPGLDWLFSKDRKAGEKKAYSTSVVYIIKPANLSDVKTVKVRHILVQPEQKDEDGNKQNINLSEADKSQKKAAKEKAESILKEYNDGKKTEDEFAALAKKYSTDSNAKEGGLYENVVPHQMVSSFDAWCYDSSRKSGDVEIVETEYGYHLMYYVAENKTPAWKYTAQQALASDSSTNKFDEIDKKVKIEKAYPGAWYFEIDTDIDR